MPKATHADFVRKLTDIPNIGVLPTADLESIGEPEAVGRLNRLAAYEFLRTP